MRSIKELANYILTYVPNMIHICPNSMNEGIISKKIINPTILYSLMEQQLKGNDTKVEERDIHMVARNR